MPGGYMYVDPDWFDVALEGNFSYVKAYEGQFLIFGTSSHKRKKPPLNAHADVSSWDRNLNIGQSLHLHPYFVFGSSKAFGHSTHLRRLAIAFTVDNAIISKFTCAGSWMIPHLSTIILMSHCSLECSWLACTHDYVQNQNQNAIHWIKWG